MNVQLYELLPNVWKAYKDTGTFRSILPAECSLDSEDILFIAEHCSEFTISTEGNYLIGDKYLISKEDLVYYTMACHLDPVEMSENRHYPLEITVAMVRDLFIWPGNMVKDIEGICRNCPNCGKNPPRLEATRSSAAQFKEKNLRRAGLQQTTVSAIAELEGLTAAILPHLHFCYEELQVYHWGIAVMLTDFTAKNEKNEEMEAYDSFRYWYARTLVRVCKRSIFEDNMNYPEDLEDYLADKDRYWKMIRCGNLGKFSVVENVYKIHNVHYWRKKVLSAGPLTIRNNSTLHEVTQQGQVFLVASFGPFFSLFRGQMLANFHILICQEVATGFLQFLHYSNIPEMESRLSHYLRRAVARTKTKSLTLVVHSMQSLFKCKQFWSTVQDHGMKIVTDDTNIVPGFAETILKMYEKHSKFYCADFLSYILSLYNCSFIPSCKKTIVLKNYFGHRRNRSEDMALGKDLQIEIAV